MEKNQAIFVLKAVAITGVISNHIVNRRFEPETREWLSHIYPLCSWCVLLFFAISGWLHALSEQKRHRPFRDYLLQKVTRLLMPFIGVVVVYSMIWQAIQHFGGGGMAADVPNGFLEKIFKSLWPVGRTVADQLYFLPMLFFISIGAQILLSLGRLPAVIGTVGIAFAAGLIFFPTSPNMGFLPGVWVWGVFSYAAGFCIFSFGRHRLLYVILFFFVGIAVVLAGFSGFSKTVCLLLLAGGVWIPCRNLKVLPMLGEASGTIYLYHQPFLLQAMLIVVAMVGGNWLVQFFGALAAAAAAIVLCTVFYFVARRTPLRGMLL